MLAVLYDIHANLPALEAVVRDAREAGADEWLLGGDYVGFGPFPRETLELLDSLRPATWIRGNGERWIREPSPDLPEVLPGIELTKAAFDQATLERLYGLPTDAERDGTLFVHGSPASDVESFAREPQEGEESMLAGVRDRSVVFGHSHLQFRRPGPNGTDLVNPGSVGMPLDGDQRAAWASWDSDFVFHRVAYDVERAIAAAPEGPLGEMLVGRYQRASD
jgi:diadenosine tetraphosphatase ApaH/serine/threonine PP2A family protein phosphatase